MFITIAVVIGFIADRIFGDPVYSFHPARIMGWFISRGEKILRRGGRRKAGAFLSGMLLTLLLTALSFGLPFLLLSFLYSVHFAAGLTIEMILCYQLFAARALRDESMKVYYSLHSKDTSGARMYLSYIVGRDTQVLNDEEISKAAVETVAENLSDGVIAPMLFMLVGGAPLGMACKAVNTLDSMIGYKDERYEYFGKFAARLDDLINLVPSRISALLSIIASILCRMDTKKAIKVFVRDRYKHKSPNSAQTESVFAGALGIRLSGGSSYGGKPVSKPFIGDAVRDVSVEDIKTANKLMYTTSWLGLIVGVGIRVLLFLNCST